MDCLGQSSFETRYALGMRQPHSSLVILFQLEHGEDPATVRPLRAEVPVHPLCWFLSKSKYALGMRWTFFRPRTRLTYAPEVCAQVCAEPEAPMGSLGHSSFETGYAPGMRQPHSSLVIWIQLEHEQALAGINLEQGYASGVCAAGMR